MTHAFERNIKPQKSNVLHITFCVCCCHEIFNFVIENCVGDNSSNKIGAYSNYKTTNVENDYNTEHKNESRPQTSRDKVKRAQVSAEQLSMPKMTQIKD